MAEADVPDAALATKARSSQPLDTSKRPAASPQDTPSRLISIPCSHYSDKARWALDMAGHPYREDLYPPLIHLLGTTFGGLKARSVPQLVSPDWKLILPSSNAILKWAAQAYPDTLAGQLYPPGKEDEVDKWVQLFDKRIGPQVRVIIYHHMFQDGPQAVMSVLVHKDMPAWRVSAFRALFPFIKFLICKGMRVNASNAEHCTARVRSVFAEVSEALSDGRPFLVPGCTAPTAADITFAALAAPLLAPANVGGHLQIDMPTPSTPDWPGTELAVTRAGKHVHRMYEQWRMPADALRSSGNRWPSTAGTLPSPA